MQKTFDHGEVSRSPAAPRMKCRAILLHVTEGEAHPDKGPNPFLNGKITAVGSFLEECLPSNSALRAGMEVGLKIIGEDKRWSAVTAVVGYLAKLWTTADGKRLYEWPFFVVGVVRDPLTLFGKNPEELDVTDLLALLGATREDLGGMVFNSEGGFTEAPQ